MRFLAWILFGALAGWIASKIMNTDAQQGALANIVVGIVGAMIGGFLVSAIGGDDADGFDLYSLFVAVTGSVIFIGILKAVRK
ncbi:TPA: GlsB/YeaQ/YmgE family stress response membrane protein [Candidatus Saccharibacteria bacterium]|nr:GlsB/YeaQ/YmgE family stress response membrane protein [Candidatus Saccharibacteria bacterium]HIO87871.1 GlsB/YeaQ/YmgE family stress response membrane protein [Candidatus Saccharibacteria bacterium]